MFFKKLMATILHFLAMELMCHKTNLATKLTFSSHYGLVGQNLCVDVVTIFDFLATGLCIAKTFFAKKLVVL